MLKWLKKYLILTRQEIENNNFMPTLTGGLDTRILTWFWRDLYDSPDYYLKAVKTDGKNKIARGQAEVEISNQVLSNLGKSLNRVEYPERLTISGIFTENGRNINRLNDPAFIYDYIVFHFAFGKKQYFNLNFVCPFADNLYLQLWHPELHYMRTLLALLLCPDLLKIPLYGFNSKPAYIFNQEFAYLIPKVEQFIQKYDLRKRVAKLKARIYNTRDCKC